MRNAAVKFIAIVGAALLALPTASVPAVAVGSATLAQVEARGVLPCRVSDGIAGFSQPDASGHWSGIDVDLRRTVAAVTAEPMTSVDVTSADMPRKPTSLP